MRIQRGVLVAVGGLLLALGAQWGAWSQPRPGIQQAPGAPPLGGMFTGSDEMSQVDPQIHVDAAGRVYRLWVDSWQGQGGDLRFQRSVDGGQSWTAEPMVLDRDKPKSARSTTPMLITDAAGRVMAIWRTKFHEAGGKKEIQFLSSPDAGATWPGPVRVLNRDGSGFSGELSADGQGHVYAVWYDERSNKSASADGVGRASRGLMIFFNRSEDFGQNWLTEDVRLSGDEGAGKPKGPASISALPHVQSDRQGRVYVAWVDNRSGRTEIYIRVSQDHGKSWGPEINVSRGALSATNHQILTDGAGRMLLVWSDGRYGPEDIFFARSEDAGKQWSEPARLTRHPQGVAPSTAPHMAMSRDGRVYVAWQDVRNGREDIFLNISADWGRTWLDKDIRLDRDEAGTGVSQFPHVLVRADGRVVVAWSDDRTGHDQILLTQSGDGGKTWLDREIRVDMDMDTKPGERARGVKLATDANGVVYAVWEVWKGEGAQIQKRVAYRRLVLAPVTGSGAPAAK